MTIDKIIFQESPNVYDSSKESNNIVIDTSSHIVHLKNNLDTGLFVDSFEQDSQIKIVNGSDSIQRYFTPTLDTSNLKSRHEQSNIPAETSVVPWDYIVPVLTFLLGFIGNIIYRHFNEGRKVESMRTYYLFWINKNLESIKKLNKLHRQFRSRLKASTHIHGVEMNTIKPSLKKLNTLDQSYLMKSFVFSSKEKTEYMGKLFYKISNDIDYVQSCIDQKKEIFADYQDKVGTLTEQWNTRIKQVQYLKNRILNVTREEISSDPILFRINEIFNDWMALEEDASNIYLTNGILLIPLNNYLMDRFNENPADTRIGGLIEAVQSCQSTIKQYNSYKKGYIEIMDEVHLRLTNTTKHLPGTIKKLSQAKYKWWVTDV